LQLIDFVVSQDFIGTSGTIAWR